MTPKEVAEWLINEDGNGASDEEFAEMFVYLRRISKGNTDDIKTSEEMTDIDVDKLCEWIKKSLDEIIFGEECDLFAWWKRKE